MSRNAAPYVLWIANVVTVWGGKDLFLEDEAAVAKYNADRDAYAARHFGLSKIEYYQWLDLEGAPLCAHRTKGGDLCRNNTGGYQLEPKEWKARHRKFFCASHAPDKPKKRKK